MVKHTHKQERMEYFFFAVRPAHPITQNTGSVTAT